MLLFFISSCQEDDATFSVLAEIGESVQVQPAAEEVVVKDVATDNVTDVIDTFQDYYFDQLTGNCLSNKDELGYNDDEFQECGNLSGLAVKELDFDQKGYYGLNIENTTIINEKIQFKKVAEHEVRFNSFTVFQGEVNPFTHLFDQHKNLIRKQRKRFENLKRKIFEVQDQIASIEKTIIRNEAPEVEDKLLEKIDKLNQQIDNLTDITSVAESKIKRHKAFAVKSYHLAKTEKAFEKLDVKNKKWLNLKGRQGKSTNPANELFDGVEKFSTSIWFKTEKDQNNKRLVSFHHDGNKSALVLTLNKGQVILGYRNSDAKYFTLNYGIDYNDDKWHNLVGTYDGTTFKLFVDGHFSNSIQSSFAGFGDDYTNFGSYQEQSNFFVGQLDEASIWAKALDLGDIELLYNNGIPSNLNRHPSSPELLKWWRMGDKFKKQVAGKLFN